MTAGRPRDPDAVRRYVERFASFMAEAGFPRMPARVFVALLVADAGRMTAAELAELLHVSPAAISGAVRYLIQVNLVGREREPRSRRDYYRLFDEVWYEAMVRRDQVMARMEAHLRDGIEVVGADTPAGVRMAGTLEFFGFMREEIAAMVEKWRAQRAAASKAPAAATAGEDRRDYPGRQGEG